MSDFPPDELLSSQRHESRNGRQVEVRILARYGKSGDVSALLLESHEVKGVWSKPDEGYQPRRLASVHLHPDQLPEVVETLTRFIPAEPSR